MIFKEGKHFSQGGRGGWNFSALVIMHLPPRKRLAKSLIRPSCKNCCLLPCVIYQSPCISPFISFKSIFVLIMQVLTSIRKFLQLLVLMFRLCKISFFLHNLFSNEISCASVKGFFDGIFSLNRRGHTVSQGGAYHSSGGGLKNFARLRRAYD